VYEVGGGSDQFAGAADRVFRIGDQLGEVFLGQLLDRIDPLDVAALGAEGRPFDIPVERPKSVRVALPIGEPFYHFHRVGAHLIKE
jgi:hypothetical protein